METLSLFRGSDSPAAPASPPPAAVDTAAWLRSAAASLDTARSALALPHPETQRLLLRHAKPAWALLLERCPHYPVDPRSAVVLLYAVDESFAANPAPLVHLAASLRRMRKEPPADVRLAPVLEMLRCVWREGRSISLPLDLTDGAEVYLACAALEPFAIPPPSLPDAFLPLLVLPEATGLVAPLPALCWPSPLW